MRNRAMLLGLGVVLMALGACSYSFSDPETGSPGASRWSFKEEPRDSWRFESPLTNNYGAVGPGATALR